MVASTSSIRDYLSSRGAIGVSPAHIEQLKDTVGAELPVTYASFLSDVGEFSPAIFGWSNHDVEWGPVDIGAMLIRPFSETLAWHRSRMDGRHGESSDYVVLAEPDSGGGAVC